MIRQKFLLLLLLLALPSFAASQTFREVLWDDDNVFSATVSQVKCGSGTLSYSRAHHTLTLNNAETDKRISVRVPNDCKEFKVRVLGQNKIASLQFVSMGNVTIECVDGGTLEFSALGIESRASILTIRDCSLIFNSTFGISGFGNEHLYVENSTLSFKTTSYAVSGFEKITIIGPVFSPADLSFKEYDGAQALFGTGTSPFMGTATITAGDYGYGIYIAGQQLTSANRTIEAGSGTVSYNALHKRLTLDNAEIDGEDIGIKVHTASPEKLQVELVGKNVINVNKTAFLNETAEELHFFGGGRLELTSRNADAIDVGGCEKTILEKCSILANGSRGVVFPTQPNMATLFIIGADLHVNGKMETIAGFNSISLDDSEFVYPEGANIGYHEGKAVVKTADGQLVVGEMRIDRIYPVSIAGRSFTPTRLEIPCASGKATFDPHTFSLILDEATIDGIIEVSIMQHERPSVTIKLKGHSSAKGLWLRGSALFTLEGLRRGVLIIESVDDAFFVQDASTLHIRNCTLKVSGLRGLTNWTQAADPTVHLMLENVNVNAKGKEGSLCNFASITLVSSELTAPESATIGEYPARNFSVIRKGVICTNEVIISALHGAVGDNEELEDETPVREAALAAVSVYPNPCGDLLRVTNASSVSGYTVLNVMGQPLAQGAHDGSDEFQLDLSILPPGIYLLQLQAGGAQRSIKVLRE